MDVFRHHVACPPRAAPAAEPSSLPVLGANVKPRVQPAQTALPHRLPSSLLLQPPSPDAVAPIQPGGGRPLRLPAAPMVVAGRGPRPPKPGAEAPAGRWYR